VVASHAEIIDNTDGGFSVTGNWSNSSSITGYYGSDYRYAASGDGSTMAIWTFVINEETQYSIYAQWTDHALRASDAPYTIYLNGTEVETVLVDQRYDGGRFNLLGSYNLVPGTLEVVLTNNASNFVVADAVQVIRNGPPVNTEPDGVIDNTDAGFSVAGNWSTSSNIDGYYGIDYRYAAPGDGATTANWSFAISEDGNYSIYAQWTAHPLRASDAPYTIYLNGTAVETVFIDQQDNGGRFNLLGSYNLVPGTLEVVLNNNASNYVVADAVQLIRNGPPVNMGIEGVIDNTDAGFSVAGNWSTSSSIDGYYGIDYRYAAPGDGATTANWTFAISEDGQYSIYAQWTAHPLRASDAPYTIYLNGTEVETVFIDQRYNGGRLNLLGSYNLVPGTLEVVLNNNASNFVVADAVQVIRNGPPVNTTPDDVIDNTDVGFSVAGSWGTSSSVAGYYGSDYRFVAPGDGSSYATWSFGISSAGQYEVAAHWTEASSNRPIDARYNIFNNGIKLGSVVRDQTQDGTFFVSLGTYNVAVGTLEVQMSNAVSQKVLLGSLEPSYPIADAMRIAKVGSASILKIYSPSDLSIKTSPDVTIQALAINFPSSWETEFVIDGDMANSIRVSGSTIELDSLTHPILAGVSFAEHTIQARMVDENGDPQSDFVQVDFGIGNYNVGFGDSITEARPGPGQNDDVPEDDISNDGRNGGGGYQPILNNILTATEGRPQTVENEGIGGQESIHGLARVYSMLAAHPGAQRILVLFGTNDSSGSMPVPSGLGPGPPAPGTFEFNMQQIIDAIDPEGTGKIPVLAKVPMRFGDSGTGIPYANPESHPKNLLIEEYNAVIDELKYLNPMIEVLTGPPFQSDNFFTYFRDLSRVDGIPIEFADNLHPNGIGFQSVARLWCETLTGTNCD